MTMLNAPQWQAAPDAYPIYLKDNYIHIWRFTFDAAHKTTDYWNLLAEDEKDRALQFYFQKDYEAYLFSRGILRSILSKYIGIPPEMIRLKYTPYGKPWLDLKQNSMGLCFNVSHTHACILYALTKNIEIGVDVEYLKNDLDYQGIAKRFFSNDEYQALLKVPPLQQGALFYQIWTCKEAFIKAIGLGLSYSLADFDVAWQADQPAKILHIKDAPDEAKQWSLHAFTPADRYIAAIATQQPIHQIIYYISPSKLHNISYT